MYCLVAIAKPVGGPFSYAIPAHLDGQISLGSVVLVPFGRRGAETGYVTGLSETVDFNPAKVKPVSRLLDPIPAFDAQQLAFFQWVANYYLAQLGQVIHTALPSRMSAKILTVLEPTEDGVQALADGVADGDPALVLREAISRPGLTRRGLVRRADPLLTAEAADKAVAACLRQEWLAWGEREVNESRARMKTVALAVPLADAKALVPKAGSRMRAILEALDRAEGPIDLPALVAEQGSTVRSAVNRLKDAGAVTIDERERRDAMAEAPAMGPSTAPVLNDDQAAALAALTGPDRAKAWLLFGVTGSGKTEVFLGAAADCLRQDRQVLVLVPEIGLTPQLVGRFKARFGDEVAVLHSGLTGAERLAEWRRIRAGEARIAVGARSALFAPFTNLGLVVVDEEHDDSYKQDDGVRYNARDLAVVLGHRHKGATILASATPSMESWSNAQSGKYGLLSLPKRATPRPVPKVEVVDLTSLDTPKGQEKPMFHPDVVAALRQTFDAGGKAIVLYNRRGYATMVRCDGCGGSYGCPNCGITLTLHQKARSLACHYCGFKVPVQKDCPSCGKPDLKEVGKGTERVEETLAGLFPDIPQARMDADTTAVRGSHHRILQGFRDGESRLLVGTQIVAKGHDFPDVHTAVVVSADSGFRMPDFRAAERTWALLVQVAGRAGRGDVPGRVFVQTWDPEHYVLATLSDSDAFYAMETRLRKTLKYPPVGRLVLIRFEGAHRQATVDIANALANDLRRDARNAPGVDVLGPAPAALARLVGRWRFQLILRGMDAGVFRRFLSAWRERLTKASGKGVRVIIDVDPRNLM